MTSLKITVAALYPDLMSTYGDRGNVAAIVRRCDWRDISVQVINLGIGDKVAMRDIDLFMIGGGGEAQQRLVAADLHRVKGPWLREAVQAGAAALAVGAGFELFGRFCQPEKGTEFRGIELFDCWTIRNASVLADHRGTISEGRADRFVGELVVHWGSTLLVGFEHHSGGTYLGPAAQPLGQVVSGHGNNGDGTEGVILGNAVGTNLRGPCLPKNPELADFLISAALAHRYGNPDLAPLADDLEHAARAVVVQQARPRHRVRLRAGVRR